MPELDLVLRELSGHIEFPPTPELASAVRRRLGERTRTRRRPVAIAFAVLAVALGAVLAVPPARTAILEWLGIKGVRIVHVDKLPPAPAAGNLRLGRQVTLDEARRRAPWLVVPKDQPDRVYYNVNGQVTLLWGTPTDVRLLLNEFRGVAFIDKLVQPGSKVEPVRIDGSPGAWLGDQHVLMYRDPAGNTRESTARLVGQTLVWQRGEVTLRLEGDLSKGDAVRIARSAR
jgi:hypothetical protein